MKKLFILISVLSFKSQSKIVELKPEIAQPQSEILDLFSALVRSLKVDYDIQLKQCESDQAKAARKAALETLYIPQLTLHGQVGHNRERRRENATRIDHNRTTLSQASAQISYTVFRGGQDVANLNAANHGLKVTHYAVCQTMQATLSKTIGLYVDYLASQESIKVAKEYYANAQKIERYSKAMAQEGKSLVNIPVAEAELTKARNTLYEAQNNNEKAKKSLEGQLNMLVGTKIKPPKIKFDCPSSLEEFKKRISENNPGVLKAKFSIYQSEAAIRSAQGGITPTVDLSLNANATADRTKTTHGYGANIDIKWTPYNIQQNQNVRNAYIALTKAKIELNKLINELYTAAGIVWTNRIISLKEIATLESEIKFLSKAVEIMSREVALGFDVTQVDLLNSINRLIETRKQLVAKQTEMFKIQAQMLEFEGRLHVSCSL